MENTKEIIDDLTIKQVGLILTDKPMNVHGAPDARIFKYPGLDNVYIMENDLYGNVMPAHCCFLAFQGKKGMIGKQLKIATLRSYTQKQIKSMVASNSNG